jgi:Tfp pilus assembly protein PilN
VSISGFARSAGEVGTYREKLSQSAIFQYVDVESLVAGTDPVDSLVTGVNFRITLTLKVAEAKQK